MTERSKDDQFADMHKANEKLMDAVAAACRRVIEVDDHWHFEITKGDAPGEARYISVICDAEREKSFYLELDEAIAFHAALSEAISALRKTND